MRKFKLSVNGRWYEIEIKDLEERPISVLVDGELYQVELETGVSDTPVVRTDERRVLVSEPAAEVSGPIVAEGEVIAPMPGKILAIKVRVGDRVQYQDVLCTLEAMKMESEIMSPAEGMVKEVRVAEGQEVMYGDVLFAIG